MESSGFWRVPGLSAEPLLATHKLAASDGIAPERMSPINNNWSKVLSGRASMLGLIGMIVPDWCGNVNAWRSYGINRKCFAGIYIT